MVARWKSIGQAASRLETRPHSAWTIVILLGNAKLSMDCRESVSHRRFPYRGIRRRSREEL